VPRLNWFAATLPDELFGLNGAQTTSSDNSGQAVRGEELSRTMNATIGVDDQIQAAANVLQ
jgi:hypothetical protein